ncbi:MAG TPA: hypothetical protein VG759_09420 [Candidatus Angelobacter sp.]|jgi:hypothetical protein|nr:hypothetical protein [Candidatus Angelobacter sp.]
MKLPFLVLLFASFAVAQNQSAKEDPGLRFARMAFNASNAVEHQSLEGYVAVFVDDKNWTALSKDSDLGPFLKLKEQKAERRLVFFYSGPDGQRVVVYFDGPAATDVAVFTPGPNAKVTADLLKPVPEKLKANAATDGWTFTPESVNSDNGEEVPGYRITKAEPKK